MEQPLSLPKSPSDCPDRNGTRRILRNLKIKSDTLWRNWNLYIFREPELHTTRLNSSSKRLVVLVGQAALRV